MKDFTKKDLEAERPTIEPYEAVDFCLKKLYADKSKICTDNIVQDLTFEEVIGALLLARDVIRETL